jgi:phosphonate transport system permease protein
VTTASSPAAEAVFASRRRDARVRGGQAAVVLALVALCLWYGGFFDPERYAKGLEGMVQIVFREGLPPDFARAPSWVVPLVDTVAMSVAGTALCVAISFVLGFLGARNTAPHPAVYAAVRMALNGLRAVPELIMGILILACVGLGILPGILALGLHSAGMVGKFFAESIEHADPAPIEAVRACGATELQVLWHGVLPQVLPQMADVSFYRWEYNFRASTVMGMVGCGGIGFQLHAALNLMEYREVTALLLVVLLCVTGVDALSAAVRRRFQ